MNYKIPITDEPVDLEPRYLSSDDPAAVKLREYHRSRPRVVVERKPERADPSANITKALLERNRLRAIDLHERTVRGLALYKGGMAIEDVAREVGLIPRKLKERWKKLPGAQL